MLFFTGSLKVQDVRRAPAGKLAAWRRLSPDLTLPAAKETQKRNIFVSKTDAKNRHGTAFRCESDCLRLIFAK